MQGRTVRASAQGELKANRVIVGTDARAVRPYMRMNNQLDNLFTLSTR